MKGLVRCAQRLAVPRAAVRVFSAEAAPASSVYEHISNMKTADLFQFEPFNESDLLVSLHLEGFGTNR